MPLSGTAKAKRRDAGAQTTRGANLSAVWLLGVFRQQSTQILQHGAKRVVKINPYVKNAPFNQGYFNRSHALADIFRSHHLEYSDTHQNIELKHGWAGLVLG